MVIRDSCAPNQFLCNISLVRLSTPTAALDVEVADFPLQMESHWTDYLFMKTWAIKCDVFLLLRVSPSFIQNIDGGVPSSVLWEGQVEVRY